MLPSSHHTQLIPPLDILFLLCQGWLMLVGSLVALIASSLTVPGESFDSSLGSFDERECRGIRPRPGVHEDTVML